jgi:hypothetical protein
MFHVSCYAASFNSVRPLKHQNHKVVLRPRRLFTSLSPRGPGFSPRLARVGFVVVQVIMGHVSFFPEYLDFSSGSIILLVFHVHLFIHHRSFIFSATDIFIKLQTKNKLRSRVQIAPVFRVALLCVCRLLAIAHSSSKEYCHVSELTRTRISELLRRKVNRDNRHKRRVTLQVTFAYKIGH